jgi:Kef-type K+ transport system membrane component KefB
MSPEFLEPLASRLAEFLAARPELGYVALLFLLIVLPRILVRWKIPTAITSLALGAIAGLGFGAFLHDPTVQLLSTLGISALFLFAGLEVDLDELASRRRVLAQHVVIRLLALPAFAYLVVGATDMTWRASLLFVLAIITPSAGFILDSLGTWPLSPDQRNWVRSTTIATELVSLLALFFVMQSASPGQFVAGTTALVVLVLVLPLMFRAFARWIAPYAPNSDFAFLLMLALVAAFTTRKLGAYYLVGACVVGRVAQRFRENLPTMSSEHTLHAVEVFASFFIPFYFFNAGLHLRAENFGLAAFGVGLVCVLAIGLRIGLVAVHRRIALGEPLGDGARVGISLAPTLVFTLVIAELLRDSFGAPAPVFGGLVIYALFNTVVPTLLLKAPPPLFDQPLAATAALDEGQTASSSLVGSPSS